MAEERKNIHQVTGAAAGGHATSVAFNRDEAGRLEVIVGVGPNPAPAIAIVSAEDAKVLIGLLRAEFGEAAPKSAPAKPAASKPVTHTHS